MNEYFEKINRNNFLTLVPTMKLKKKILKYEDLGSKIRGLVRSITKTSDDWDEKYMKVKLNSNNELLLNKTL